MMPCLVLELVVSVLCRRLEVLAYFVQIEPPIYAYQDNSVSDGDFVVPNFDSRDVCYVERMV